MKHKRLLTLLLLALTFCCCAGVSAASDTVAVQMDPSISITIDGEPFIAKDVDGKFIYPFAIKGNTYLPVRALSYAAGYDVEWVGSTQSILLTTATVEHPLYTGAGLPRLKTNKATGYYRPAFKIFFNGERFYPLREGKSIDPVAVEGSTFLPLRVICERAGFTVNWDGATRNIELISPQSPDNEPAVGTAPRVVTGWARVDYWPQSGQPGFYQGYNLYIPQFASKQPGAVYLNGVIRADYAEQIAIAENKTGYAKAGAVSHVISYDTARDSGKGILSVAIRKTTTPLKKAQTDSVQIYHYNYATDTPVDTKAMYKSYGVSGEQLVAAGKAAVGVYGEGGKGSGASPAIKKAWLGTIAKDYNALNFYAGDRGYVVYYLGQSYGIEVLGSITIPYSAV